MTSRALIFINPQSRMGRDRKAEAIAALESHGLEVVDASDRPVERLPVEFGQDRSIDRVVIGGGDGTLNRALEALIELKLPVGLLPLGTANDLAATLGIPANLKEACAIAADENVRRIDLGWVNGKHFVNEGSLGLSNQIVRDLDPLTKRRWGIFGILANTARVVARARRFRAWLRCDDKSYDVWTLQVTVGNGERFGGFVKIASADISDHQLDLYSLEVENALEIVRLMPALARGKYSDRAGVRLERGREIEVRTERPRHVYTDGERATKTPALFRLVPSALDVFVARAQAQG